MLTSENYHFVFTMVPFGISPGSHQTDPSVGHAFNLPFYKSPTMTLGGMQPRILTLLFISVRGISSSGSESGHQLFPSLKV